LVKRSYDASRAGYTRIRIHRRDQEYCVKSLSGLERIENVNTQIGDVGGVACHQCQAVDFGGCQQAVDNRQRAISVEPPPFIGDRAIDRQNAAIAVLFEVAGVEFIDENGGGLGVRLRKRQRPQKPK
jgi:hypothetical protein